MQLRAVIVARGIGEREVAAVAILHHDLQILSGLERRAQADRKTQRQHGDVRRGVYEAEHLRGDRLAAEDVDALEALRTDRDIRARPGAAHQRRAVLRRSSSAAALLDFAVEERSPASVAGALAAGT